ncbi:RHS repeat-associated core domain-containing protein [Rheinheimera sp. MMS21-TC3]|uniref:RHS repeat-associated core domain-containing protein n=1 Tax=Rheinheimera sp. MMS21-TC3 TaxID=3072790 RepID=UPI0028C39797|nr:RHS repeat-associated core domain-containing protein [Rheinheimera sp. MMS21-TC3]WNO61010.1 RHS repeat-associated core domain-containing protein [Rheinheimera sp. MMS21-TC3]
MVVITAGFLHSKSQWRFGNPTGDGIEVKQGRLLRFHENQYQYDDNGNQLAATAPGKRQQREFNGFNQLTALQQNDAVTRYEYDAFGRRSAKITAAGRTDYLWEGNTLIGEYCQGEYRWYVFEPNTNKPLALISGGQLYFYQLDQLGTPLSLTDSENNIVWQAHYTVFGKATVTVNEIDNPIRFQGQYYDNESGLHYNHFRYYDPETGRFISQDPIGLLGGINHYQYAPNHINWIDPLGLSCKENAVNVFSTQDQAANAALKLANPLSITDNLEYGGLIYRDENGNYGFSGPVKGSDQGVNPHDAVIPDGATLVGDYHTHGDYSLIDRVSGAAIRTGDPLRDEFNSDNFSAGDYSGIRADARGISGYRGYLGTPGGLFKVFNPEDGTVSVLKE